MIGRLAVPAGFRAFRHAAFRFYWAGMLARGTAMWMLFVAIPWLAVELGGSAVHLGVIGALLFLPTLVATPLAGLWADNHRGAGALLAGQAASSVQAVVLLALVLTGAASIEVLALLALAFGALVAIEVPIRQVYVAELVPPDEIPSAVSLHSTAFNTTRFTGPSVCAVLIAAAGIEAAFAVAGVLSLLSVLSIVMIERVRVRKPDASDPNRVRVGPRDAFRYVRQSKDVRLAMVLASAASVFGIMTFQTLAPVYVVEQLGTGGGDYGALMTMWGAGAVAGAYASTVVVHGRRLPWLLLGTAGILGGSRDSGRERFPACRPGRGGRARCLPDPGRPERPDHRPDRLTAAPAGTADRRVLAGVPGVEPVGRDPRGGHRRDPRRSGCHVRGNARAWR